MSLTRRSLLARTAALAAATACAPALRAADAPVPRRNIPLGFDNFSIRAMGWKAPQLVDYAVAQKLDSVFITNLDAFESLDTPYLFALRTRAAERGVRIIPGTWSICPSSSSFKKTWGSAEDHGALAIRVASDLGSPVVRVILGTGKDRETPGGIQARIADMAATCKALRSRCQDLNVRIAIENHAGDLQAVEMLDLVQAAGPDWVGVTYDSGNAVWTLDEPLQALERLAPHVLATHLRDTQMWTVDDGVDTQWMPMGDGVVDLPAIVDLLAKRCPGVGVHCEIIGGFNRRIPFKKPGFMEQWPRHAPADLERFAALARNGKPQKPGRGAFANDQDFQKHQLERSLAYCRERLGLGLKP